MKHKLFTVDEIYLHPFFERTPFLHPFCLSEKEKKSLSDFRRKIDKIDSEEKLTKIMFFFFIWVIFLQRSAIFALFVNFKFPMFLIGKTLHIDNFIRNQ